MSLRNRVLRAAGWGVERLMCLTMGAVDSQWAGCILPARIEWFVFTRAAQIGFAAAYWGHSRDNNSPV